MIRSALLLRARGLGHAHSTRADGPVGPLSIAAAAAGRAALVRAAGGDPAALCVPHQVHGARVAVAETAARVFPETDALVAAAPGVPLLAQGADCPLVALHDQSAHVAAVCHSGWRGTSQRIVARTVDAMRTLGADPSRVAAAVFPGIGPCCFEVGLDVVAAFREAFGDASLPWFASAASAEKRFLDVRRAIVATLRSCGVPGEGIELVPGCTACGGELYSHRASRGAPERHGLCVVLTHGGA